MIVSSRGKLSCILSLLALSTVFLPGSSAAQMLYANASDVFPTAGGQQDQSSNQQQGSKTHQTEPLPLKEEPGVPARGKTAAGEDKRIFGVLPNYRTAEMQAEYHPLTPGQKMRIAFKDSFDYPLMILAAAYAGLYQLEDSHPEFGQGMEGYAKRLGTSYCDQVTGNIMTEGIMPIVLHEDPRYFRLAHGTKMHRTLYALSRIVVTKTDSGHTTFNFAEVVGNGIAAGVGLSYYPDNRNVPDYMLNWGTELGTDAVSQVLKEFWPDVKRWWYLKHHKDVQ